MVSTVPAAASARACAPADARPADARPDGAPPGDAAPGDERGTGRFRPDIEGMRAVAVILVVLYHCGVSPVTGGYIGVDVFFVISGFLITTQLYRELVTQRSISITRFYARRATRLLPASTLALVATVVAAWLWLPPTRFESISLDAMASAFYGINWRLAGQGVDYLNVGAPPSPLQHFWSLAVEEQFYLVWPLLLVAVASAWRRGWVAPGRRSIVVALLVIAAGSFAASVYQTASAAPWAYFGAHTRTWELAVGALLAIVVVELARLPRAVAAAATWVGLAAVVTAALWFTDATPFPGYAAALPVLGTALMIAGGCAAPTNGVVSMFRYRPFQLIGKLSYGWYLWHWPVLLIVPSALALPPDVRINLILAACSLGLAAVSFWLVEQPIRARPRLKAQPWRGISLGLSLSAAVLALAVVGSQLAVPLRYGRSAVDARAVVADAADPAAALAGLIRDGVGVTEPPANLTPRLIAAANDSPAVYAESCHLSFSAVRAGKPCEFGDTRSKTTVVLFGDSHAAQWFPALHEIAKARRWRLLSYTKSACPAASVRVSQGALKRPYTECEQWRDRTLTAIAAAEPAMVVMTNIGTDSGGLVEPSANNDQLWLDGWLTSVRRVQRDGTEVVLLSDTPFPAGNVPDCVSTHLTDVGRCARDAAGALVYPARRALIADGLTRAGVSVIDPAPWFCGPAVCPVIVGNILVYKDDHHMSTAYAEMLAPVLARALP